MPLRAGVAKLLDRTPEVATRLGIDSAPIDLTSPVGRAWLECFVWPEEHERRPGLREAIAVASGQAVWVGLEGRWGGDVPRPEVEYPARPTPACPSST